MPRVGLISDTHGLLRPQATEFLRGSDFVIHAGDDKGAWAEPIPETAVLQVGEVSV